MFVKNDMRILFDNTNSSLQRRDVTQIDLTQKSIEIALKYNTHIRPFNHFYILRNPT